MTTPIWFLDELLHAGDEHKDHAYVAVYDEKAGTDPNIDLETLKQFGLRETDILIDIGAGTGTFALAAASYCQQVIATDVSNAMLSQLQSKIERSGAKNIKTATGGLLSYQHEGDLADVVYSRHVFHHLPDFWKAIALQRISDLLKPGGLLFVRDLIYACPPDEIEDVIGTWLGNAPDQPDKGWTKAELITHIQQEHSTFGWLFEAMLDRAGFELLLSEHTPSKIFSTYVAVKT